MGTVRSALLMVAGLQVLQVVTDLKSPELVRQEVALGTNSGALSESGVRRWFAQWT